MKFSLSLVALVAAALAAEAMPVAQVDMLAADNGMLEKRTYQRHHHEPSHYAPPPTTNSNVNKGGSQVNQNAGGDQEVKFSDNNLDFISAAWGSREKRHHHEPAQWGPPPTTNSNKNYWGDQVNQNAGGNQKVEGSDNNLDFIIPSRQVEVHKRHYHHEPAHHAPPPTNSNKNYGGDQVNQNAGGDQEVKYSDNNLDFITGGWGSREKRHHHEPAHWGPPPTTNSNKNYWGDQVNQNAGGNQKVKGSDNNFEIPLGGIITKRHYRHEPAHWGPPPTTNSNKNWGGDQVNQNAGGNQKVVGSDNNFELPLGLAKRTWHPASPTNSNSNKDGDQVNQNSGGNQYVTGSDNNVEVGQGLLSGCGSLVKRTHYRHPAPPTTNSNTNKYGDQVNQNAGGDQTVTGSDNNLDIGSGLLSCRL